MFRNLKKMMEDEEALELLGIVALGILGGMLGKGLIFSK